MERLSPAPHGAGGLKFELLEICVNGRLSRPARGGWIEISAAPEWRTYQLSRPARGGWIEIDALVADNNVSSSRPARGGWIEIHLLWLL